MTEVWIMDTEDAGVIQRQVMNVVSAGEEEQALRMRKPDDRRRFLWGRILLRSALSSAMGGDPRDWRFIIGQTGKVLLAHRYDMPFINFNLSHSGKVVAVVISTEGRVGIDVERIEPDRSLSFLLQGIFSESEEEALKRLLSAERQRAALKLWTQKEAYAKLLGVGVNVEFSKLRIPQPPLGPQIELRELDVEGERYQLAVASESVEELIPRIRLIRKEELQWRPRRFPAQAEPQALSW